MPGRIAMLLALAAAAMAAAAGQDDRQQLPGSRPPLIINPADQPVFQDPEQDIFAADWLLARRGRYRFQEGLLTVDPEHLRRFLITDATASFLAAGSLVVEIRPGRFVSSDADPDDSLDIPASVLVTYKGRRLAGAKGYRLTAEVVDNGVEVSHDSGMPGCSQKTWLLQFSGERMIISKTSHSDPQSGRPCDPGSGSGQDR